MTTLLLVHSPLVGPSSWRPMDDAARRREIEVIRPDLTGVVHAASPSWQQFVDGAVRAAGGQAGVVVVGHSGAGAMLPVIGHHLADRLRALVFVDAIVPPAVGAQRATEDFLGFLDGLAVGGQLPKWLDWWPPDTVDQVVPSAAHRSELLADMPSLQRSFYDDEIPMPSDWTSWPCAYLQLSAAYEAEIGQAADFEWQTGQIDGSHMTIFTEPDVVLDAIDGLVNDLQDTGP